MAAPELPSILADWFAARGWTPRRHQLEMLEQGRAGRHALLVAATGAGKTLAGFLPTLTELIEAPATGLHTLYVSPLKALAVDIARNLITPVEEMGLDIRIETRTGDTPSDRKARQRVRPPQILLTTPESLSLLLSYPDSFLLFENLKTIVVDEVHAFATGKRGDLLSLCMARLQAINPALRRVALSATVADADGYRAWLAPDGDIDTVAHVQGEPGADPNIAILLPHGRVPWSGHSGRYAAEQVMAEIETHKTTLVFCNTRSLAELIFQDLWKVNELKLPIGVHHGSLAREARRKVEQAMADGRLRASGGDCEPRPWGRLGRRRLRDPDGCAQGIVTAVAADRPRQPPARRIVGGDRRAGQPLRISRGPGRIGRGRSGRAGPRYLQARRARRAGAAHHGGGLRSAVQA